MPKNLQISKTFWVTVTQKQVIVLQPRSAVKLFFGVEKGHQLS